MAGTGSYSFYSYLDTQQDVPISEQKIMFEKELEIYLSKFKKLANVRPWKSPCALLFREVCPASPVAELAD